MYLSKKQLKEIKESAKSKPLQNILSEEKNKKHARKNFADGFKDNHEDVSGKSDNRGDKDKNKNKTDIKPVNEKIRGLDSEIGGLEIDYKAIQKAVNADVDIWDEHTHNISEEALENLEENLETYKSFIHQIKTDNGRNKTMSQVDLGESSEKIKVKKPIGFVNKLRLKSLASDHGFSRGGGIGF